MKPAPPVMKIRLPLNAIRPERTPRLGVAAEWTEPSSWSAQGGTSAAPSQRARELGLRVVAVDRNGEAPGLAVADEGEVVDFTDVEAVTEAVGAIASTAC